VKDVFVVDAVRTPRARRKGKFSSIHPADLLVSPMKAVVERQGLDPASVEDVIIGCVTQTGEQGWCVARKSVLAAGWPYTVPATTVNRLCGSGQQATNFAAAGIGAGVYDIVVSGGLEHMTRVPMFSDGGGEESPLLLKHHPDLVPQGLAAELLSAQFSISREQADQYSVESQIRASRALKEGRFTKSLIPVSYLDEENKTQILSEDDTCRPQTTIEALASLKTVFKDDGIITAGNASAIVDGAAVLLLASEHGIKRHNLKPRARVVASFSIGSPPKIMLSGPIEASRGVLKSAGLKVDDIDVWEINEAFAPVPLLTMQELGLDKARVNINGGGISLGHPLGATGAMLLGTAVDELERCSGRYALITMCIGLGMGIATVIERV
jgi:acetyl-CoA acetyltransferase family protein